jgi:ubiquinone/menaquinone biosynthesis C-methylase UbiE
MSAHPVDLKDIYRQRFGQEERYRDAVWHVLCRDFFQRYVHPDSTLLDLGAGWGEFTRNISAGRKYAMDLNPDCGPRVEGYATFLQQDCSAHWEIEDNSLDIVFTSNFLEHLPNKGLVDKTLAEAFRCLKKGGKIICLGPNIKFLSGQYWDFWDHYVALTEQSLTEALALKGFGNVSSFDRFLPYSMSFGFRPPLLALRIYLKMPFVWRFFGKQFLVIAEK